MSHATGTVGIVNPAHGQRGGNRVTALRWAALLRRLGWRVFVEERWSGRSCDVLVALHAGRSHASVQRFRSAHPGLPLVVAATGTDVYADDSGSDEARASFRAATRIVVLQELALDALPADTRTRARVIHQSVEPPRERAAVSTATFDVCTIAHLRPVKDPLRPALAARLLPADSRVRIVHVGGLLDAGLGDALAREVRENPRFLWLGELTRRETLARLSGARLLVSSSRHEGGANAVSEALALGIPVLATRIPGSLGLLGADYPGTFAVGDTTGLARALDRAETDAGFHSTLARACQARAWITDPARELESWRALLAELAPSRAPASGEEG